jgi:hypothetical protein
MSDEIDATNERMEKESALIEADMRRKATEIPKGAPGECYFCGEDFARVVEVIDPVTEAKVCSCGRCRDRRGIK